MSTNQFKLTRFPFPEDKNLLPYNQADYLLVNKFNSDKYNRPVIFNDSFGFLTLSLFSHQPSIVTDSFISQKAIKHNLLNNGLTPEAIDLVYPDLNNLDGSYDSAIIKIPKSSNYLFFFLDLITSNLEPGSVIYFAGMTKHISPTLRSDIEKIFGNSSISPVEKKAVCISTIYNPENYKNSTKYPLTTEIKEYGLILKYWPNVFSVGKPDIGTRFLLDNIPDDLCGNILDFGCGSGLIGLFIKKIFPDSELTLVDESYLSIKSAEETFRENKLSAEFMLSDGISELQNDHFDTIISNPPFHQENNITEIVSLRHFSDIHNKLKPGGRFILVFNKQLNYMNELKRIFSSVKVLKSNNKFLIAACTKKS